MKNQRLAGLAGILLTIFSTFAIPAASVSMVATTGCSAASLAADAQDVANVAQQIATATKTLFPTISADLSTAASDLGAAATAFASGGTTQAKVLNLVEAVDTILSRIPIPVVQQIAQFLPIAIAAILAIYNAFGHPLTASIAPRVSQRLAPAKLHHVFGRSVRGDIKATWNDTVRTYPSAGFTEL
jgi:hypothetical protein